MRNLRLEVMSGTGKFNVFDPTEVSTRVSFRLYENGNYLASQNIDGDEELRTEDFDYDTIAKDVAIMIDKYQRRLLMSTGRKEAMDFCKLLREEADAIAEGTRKHRIEMLLRKKEGIDKELESLGYEK